ncbi:glutamate-cysteine ligase family protein [Quadrisphaera sp. DSM 44207]|uniref:glutamate-cysteine ligase family protein n=1 Tax=Quadrisphaera sp. DSM 44207 TaxID=1881057 RepID=UPI00088BF81B|nr:glutamate-cysteine ligase family protein [Quadrisphaera sp. DSM 44207]SDQ39484.1 Gamma-glutamyl:cysteine ligase YbdK, ATP-grasp superfamily [Quadrisphaera sp. DSM 44207]
MGHQVSADAAGREHRAAFRERLVQQLGVLERMLAEHPSAPAGSPCRFDATPPTIGMEVELVLVDGDLQPKAGNAAVLDLVDDTDLQPEIGAHTLELNVPPGSLDSSGLPGLEARLRQRLDAADATAAATGARILMTGLLPTLLPEHLSGEWMTPTPRYRALQEAVLAARGEDVVLDISGPAGVPGSERLSLSTPSIAPESACTSTQLHLKVAPEDFAATWNAAQLLMGPQVALGANSPFGLGRQLWAETRIPVFTQSTDTRTVELVAQGVRPRVFPGEGWASSVLDLFAENVRWFPPLLPDLGEEDPVAALEAGRPPSLHELCLHGGTIWRWNRPIYDVAGGQAHLRVENRVLPAGPTVLDVLANAAVYYGAVRVLVEDGPPLPQVLPAQAALAGLQDCARDGLAARVTWPGRDGRAKEQPVDRLLLERVIPMAADGLARYGVPREAIDRYLDVAQARAASGMTGAVWQVRTVRALQERGADRVAALRGMLARYVEGMHANEPVHTWPLP